MNSSKVDYVVGYNATYSQLKCQIPEFSTPTSVFHICVEESTVHARVSNLSSAIRVDGAACQRVEHFGLLICFSNERNGLYDNLRWRLLPLLFITCVTLT